MNYPKGIKHETTKEVINYGNRGMGLEDDINLTNKCNTNCPFCCMYSGTDKNTFMNFETFKRIIDDCKGKFELQLEGGEPILNKDIFLFMEYAISTNRCLKIIILSNGIELHKYMKRFIDIANWNKILIEFKISINYWLIKVEKDFLYNPQFFNVFFQHFVIWSQLF